MKANSVLRGKWQRSEILLEAENWQMVSENKAIMRLKLGEGESAWNSKRVVYMQRFRVHNKVIILLFAIHHARLGPSWVSE